MGRTKASVIFAAAFAVAACSQDAQTNVEAPPNEADAGTFSEIVGAATVSDGDSLRIGSRRIRLDGIIAPERRTLCGDVDIYRASTDALRQATRSEEVRCRISDLPDDRGRDVAHCRAGDTDLAEHMVAEGWAREWPAGGAYATQEAEARAAERGVWNPSCPADLWRGRDFN